MNLTSTLTQPRNARWLALGLFLLTILTRLPFASQYLYHWDSVNMAFGILDFNVPAGAPQYPGYIVYIVLAQLVNALFNDPQRTMVFISILASGLSVVTLFYLGRALFNPLTGLLAAVFLLASPLFWFYSEIALPHTLDMFTVILAAYLLYRIMVGQTRWLWLTVVYLALVGGFRQQTLMFLAPLLLFTCYRLGLVKIVLACVLGAVTMVAWFLPLMVYSNGIQAYLAGSNAYSASFFNTTSLLAGAGLFGLRRNLIKLVSYTLYGGALALIPLLYWLPWLRQPRAWLTNRKFWFLTLWLAPALAFYVVIHMGQQGLVFVFLPALLLASAEALNRLLGARPALLWGSTAAAVVLGTGIFVLAPTYPLGETGPKLLTYSTLRESDSRLHDQITTVRANFKPQNSLLLAANWRHIEYYLPEYQFARFDIGAKYEVDEGQASGADYVNQPITGEQLGLTAEDGWEVVVMDADLLAFSANPLEQITAANGFQLAYLPLQANEAYWTDGQTFGLCANEQASK
ncbi:MAG TPA: glycosyltransferase family 39 protein [Phototrophicaceae bacterium]|nr:glycosyltransferase family 39 protein [Phototrophicaceae bacterium]